MVDDFPSASIVAGLVDAVRVAHTEANRTQGVLTVNNGVVNVSLVGGLVLGRGCSARAGRNRSIFRQHEPNATSSHRIVTKLTIHDLNLLGILLNRSKAGDLQQVIGNVRVSDRPVRL